MSYLLNQHAGATSIDIGVIPFLKDICGVKTLLDIGCGPGGNVEYCRSLAIEAYGIDGDDTTLPSKSYFVHADYRRGPSSFCGPFDIGWSVEFAEHIPEEYTPNFFADFKKCRTVIFTAAPPGWGGVGHVNEQHEQYWIGKFTDNGFAFDPLLTHVVRHISNLTFKGEIRRPKKQFVKNRGLVFRLL